jgi:hypothetical protein
VGQIGGKSGGRTKKPAGRVVLRGGSAVGQIKHHLWTTWARLAIRHESEAWDARTRGLHLENPAEGIPSEFEAALEGVTAASHAIDGFYGDMRDLAPVPSATRTAWKHQGLLVQCADSPERIASPPTSSRLA